MSRCSDGFDDGNHLLLSVTSCEERLALYNFGNYAPCRPHIYRLIVLLVAKNALGRPVIPRLYVSHGLPVLAWAILLGRPEVTKLKNMAGWIYQTVLRLDVTVYVA